MTAMWQWYHSARNMSAAQWWQIQLQCDKNKCNAMMTQNITGHNPTTKSMMAIQEQGKIRHTDVAFQPGTRMHSFSQAHGCTVSIRNVDVQFQLCMWMCIFNWLQGIQAYWFDNLSGLLRHYFYSNKNIELRHNNFAMQTGACECAVFLQSMAFLGITSWSVQW